MPSDRNMSRDLAFADSHLSAKLFTDVRRLEADGIVVNLSSRLIHVDGDVRTSIQPWRSTIVRGNRILEAERIAVLRIDRLGKLRRRHVPWLGLVRRSVRRVPRQTPLYMSPIDMVGRTEEDPLAFTRERESRGRLQPFDVALKCWWSPNETDCFIHNEHPFLEVHTQVHGMGRMQKFRERDASTLYEDVVMAPGFTHDRSAGWPVRRSGPILGTATTPIPKAFGSRSNCIRCDLLARWKFRWGPSRATEPLAAIIRKRLADCCSARVGRLAA